MAARNWPFPPTLPPGPHEPIKLPRKPVAPPQDSEPAPF